MAIAIKELTESDVLKFDSFMKDGPKTKKKLPSLKVSDLVKPHNTLSILHIKSTTLKDSVNNIPSFVNVISSIYVETPLSPQIDSDGSYHLFSGYIFHEKKMYIGKEAYAIPKLHSIDEAYGEYALCHIDKYGNITLKSDYFGMSPWFYYDDKDLFLASNNYHHLLKTLGSLKIKLTMNIKRSRVNMITTGYTYGSSFSKKMDVEGCCMTLAYETLNYSTTFGLSIEKTSLWEIISKKESWNEDQYEEYLFKAKEELTEICTAIFEHPKFNEIVIDVSGGFDSRIVFAVASTLPKKLRKKIITHTRASGVKDDIEKARYVTGLYNYPTYSYVDEDYTKLHISDEINLDHISRTLGTYSVSSNLYTSGYSKTDRLELTGFIGDALIGYKRIRGELDYSLGDKKLLKRLGGCVLWNSVSQLKEVFDDQEQIIFETLNNYDFCDCLFKKFHCLYIDSRNRMIFNSSRNVENNNFRIPLLFSKYALNAKWMYFNKYNNNEVPDEKVSIDLLTIINPLMAIIPFSEQNDDVIPSKEKLLNPSNVNATFTTNNKLVKRTNDSTTYRKEVLEYIDNLDTVENMVYEICAYSEEYYNVCLGIFTYIQLLREAPEEIKSRQARDTIRKIFDIYYQIDEIR